VKKSNSFPALIFAVILGIGAVVARALHVASLDLVAGCVLAGALLTAWFISAGVQVADQWSKAVVLRLGKFRSLQGPGLFLIIPLIDTIPYWIDTRVLTTSFQG
jgi:regulator of protease activity HflC (stomatin/prohibitin superfamily)